MRYLDLPESWSGHPLQITIRRHGNQQLVLDALVDLELGVGLEVFPHRRFGIVAWTLAACRT